MINSTDPVSSYYKRLPIFLFGLFCIALLVVPLGLFNHDYILLLLLLFNDVLLSFSLSYESIILIDTYSIYINICSETQFDSSKHHFF
jgi:hypothetical protein